MKAEGNAHVGSEVALACVTVATVLGMGRLFAGTDWLVPLLVNGVVAHLVVAVARRRGLPLLTTAALAAVGAVLCTTWVGYWSTTAIGLPTGETWTRVSDDLRTAWTTYQDVVAPAPVEPGFVLASALAVWVIAYVADWAAFRLWVPFEAILPAGTLFLFTCLLGAAGGRDWAVGAFATAVLGFLLAHRVARQDAGGHWVAGRRSDGHLSLLKIGSVLGVVAVVAGTLLGPVLPGADAGGVLDPRSLRDDEPPRKTISPLVDIRARLIQLSQVELFSVRSEQPSYWRLTSLERFDGRIWSSSGSYGRAGSELPAQVPEGIDSATFHQTYSISNLAQIWLPGAYAPRALEIEDLDVLFDDESATLIVDRGRETSDGLTYSVTSVSPRVTAGDLTGVARVVPDEVMSRYATLEVELDPAVTQLARDLTVGAPTPYHAARSIQDFLRSFTYDLSVDAGHSQDDLVEFLFVNQRGYCEQFAGAFAALARSAGLPARVAVGFTQGETDPTDPNLYHVRGEHAHAWPEVYFSGAGWVSFEPTPGRGMPFAEGHTGVEPAQAAAGNPQSSESVAPAPVPEGADPATPTPPPDPSGRGEVDTTPAGPAEDAEADPEDPLLIRWLVRPLLVTLLVVSVLLLGWAIAFPLAVRLARARRRRRARAPEQRIGLAWTEAEEALALLGHRPRRSDTPSEAARTMAGCLSDTDAGAAAGQLALQVVRSIYSGEPVSDLDAAAAEEASDAVRSAARSQAPVSARVRAWLDPRPMVTNLRADRARRQRRITTTVRGDLEAERKLVSSGDRG